MKRPTPEYLLEAAKDVRYTKFLRDSCFYDECTEPYEHYYFSNGVFQHLYKLCKKHQSYYFSSTIKLTEKELFFVKIHI